MWLSVIVLLVLVAVARAKKPPSSNARPEYQAGQRWEYTTRRGTGEEGSSLIILRVEPDERQGTTVHIAAEAHAPIDKAALDKSTTTRLAANEPLRLFEQGYAHWKKAHGGVFTVSVAEVVAFADKTLNP